MSTSFNRIDVVDIAVNVLRIIGVVHDSHFNWNALLLCFQVNHIVEEMCAVAIYVANKLFQSVFCMENFLSGLAFFIGTEVSKRDAYTRIEVCKLTHSAGNDVPFVGRCSENSRVRPELLAGSTLSCFPNYFDRIERFAFFVFLLIYLSISENLRKHVRRECIHAAYTHTMQTTADLVRAFIELTAGMKHGHNDLKSRLMKFLMLINRNATTVIFNGNGAVFIERNLNICAVTCHGFVDRVIHCLVDKMMKSLLTDVANVHGRTLTNSLKPFKDLDIRGRIICLGVLIFCHFLQKCDLIAKILKKIETAKLLCAKIH